MEVEESEEDKMIEQADHKLIGQTIIDLRYMKFKEKGRAKNLETQTAGVIATGQVTTVDLDPRWSSLYVGHQPYADQITKNLLDACKSDQNKGLTVATVFSAQVFLNIKRYEVRSLLYYLLQEKSAEVFRSLNIAYNDGALKERPQVVATSEELATAWPSNWDSSRLASLIKLGIHKNDFITSKYYELKATAIVFGASALDAPSRIGPSPDCAFYYTRNALYSGMETLRISVDMHKVGVTLSNDFFSFAGAAHLSNLLRQKRILLSNWPVMDAAIAVYEKPLFHGSLPDTDDLYRSRIALCAGNSLRCVRCSSQTR